MQRVSNYRMRYRQFEDSGRRRSALPAQPWISRMFTTTPIAYADWDGCHTLPDDRLVTTRGQLHQAVQLITAAAISYLEPRSDDGHTSMYWDSQHMAFVGQPLRSFPNLHVGLVPADLTLVLLEYGRISSTIHLNATTLQEGAELLRDRLNHHGFAASRFTRDKHYTLPDYPSREEIAFDASDLEAFSTFSHLYGNVHTALVKATFGNPNASPIRIWPHHFDIACLVTDPLDPERSIGLGFSPGDDTYTEPYLYATPWPYPDLEKESLPDPDPHMHWHTAGWVGLILHYRDLCSAPDPQSLLTRFYREGYDLLASLRG